MCGQWTGSDKLIWHRPGGLSDALCDRSGVRWRKQHRHQDQEKQWELNREDCSSESVKIEDIQTSCGHATKQEYCWILNPPILLSVLILSSSYHLALTEHDDLCRYDGRVALVSIILLSTELWCYPAAHFAGDETQLITVSNIHRHREALIRWDRAVN